MCKIRRTITRRGSSTQSKFINFTTYNSFIDWRLFNEIPIARKWCNYTKFLSERKYGLSETMKVSLFASHLTKTLSSGRMLFKKVWRLITQLLFRTRPIYSSNCSARPEIFYFSVSAVASFSCQIA